MQKPKLWVQDAKDLIPVADEDYIPSVVRERLARLGRPSLQEFYPNLTLWDRCGATGVVRDHCIEGMASTLHTTRDVLDRVIEEIERRYDVSTDHLPKVGPKDPWPAPPWSRNQ